MKAFICVIFDSNRVFNQVIQPLFCLLLSVILCCEFPNKIFQILFQMVCNTSNLLANQQFKAGYWVLVRAFYCAFQADFLGVKTELFTYKIIEEARDVALVWLATVGNF